MNPVLLRKQLQDNASDLQDFCKDLKSWGEEMKRKEETLKNGDNGKTSSERTNDHKKIRKVDKNKKRKEISDTPVTKTGTTDYAAWEKFDADAECNRLEDDLNDDSELTDECNDNMQDLALIEKEKGNKFVKNQKWDEAIACYTKAIECFSYDPIFYANRALCHLKKNNFEEAENDCNLSLKLDNTYVKAYQRRSAAREGLNKLEHAEFDLLQVLKLEPNNKESEQSLEKLRRKLGTAHKISEQRPVSKFTASRNKSNINRTSTISSVAVSATSTEAKKVFDTSEPVPSWPEQNDIILVKPINKPPHLRSKMPLKRIKIKEKDDGIAETKIIESEPEAIKEQVFEKHETVEILNDNPVTNMSVFKRKQVERSLEKSDHPSALPRPDQKSNIIRSDDFKVIEKDPPNIPISKAVKNTSNVSISNETKKVEDKKLSTEFVKPKTSVQFNLTWKNLKSLEEKYCYLKQMDPHDFPKIFMNSLESSVFSGILEVLGTHFIEKKEPVFNILDRFTQVKRFGAFTMFMSAADKKHLWKLFDYVKEVEQKNKEDVDRLLEKYEM